jgi:hypothetical protein
MRFLGEVLQALVIPQHGKPVVGFVPADKDADDIYGFVADKGTTRGDVITPAISPGEWGEMK